jgi:hypothetical protein
MTNVPLMINGCFAPFGALLKVIAARTPCISKLSLPENGVIDMFWKFN